MQKRPVRDINETAFAVVQQATRQAPPPQTKRQMPKPAITAGRIGALKPTRPGGVSPKKK
jgi:hypothetical protein